MPRNIGKTCCYYRNAELELLEQPRQLLPDETPWPDTYTGMLVADAACPDCLALYIAWMDDRPEFDTGLTPTESGIRDTSFMRRLSKEPLDFAKPRYHIIEHITLERVPFEDPPAEYPPNTLSRSWDRSEDWLEKVKKKIAEAGFQKPEMGSQMNDGNWEEEELEVEREMEQLFPDAILSDRTVCVHRGTGPRWAIESPNGFSPDTIHGEGNTPTEALEDAKRRLKE